jgi:drug/metabolite transporter (DMT)-like permease
VVALDDGNPALGGNGAALALLAAWAMRDVLARRRGQEDDADLLGTLAIAVLLVLLPLATSDAHPLAGLVGGVTGILLGLVLARVPER